MLQKKCPLYLSEGHYIRGGPDKADPYIVIWLIDKNAVERAEESYTGQKADSVHIDAAYSMNQLITIMENFKTGEIAPNINALALSADNKVILDVIWSHGEFASADTCQGNIKKSG